MLQYVLIVAIYAAIPTLSVKPHEFGTYKDLPTCQAAADHFEQVETQVTKDGLWLWRAVAICAEKF